MVIGHHRSVRMFALFESGILDEGVRDMMGGDGFEIALVPKSKLYVRCVKGNNLRF